MGTVVQLNLVLAILAVIFGVVALSISLKHTRASYTGPLPKRASTRSSESSGNDDNSWILVGGVTSDGANLRIYLDGYNAHDSATTSYTLHIDPVDRDQGNGDAKESALATTAAFATSNHSVTLVLSMDGVVPGADETNSTTASATIVGWYEGIFSVSVTRLQPQQSYRYIVSKDEKANDGEPTSVDILSGRFRTPPRQGTPYNFTIALSACAMTGSRHAVFDAIAAHDVDLFVHVGDFHYAGIAQNDVSARIEAIARALTPRGTSSQARLFQSTALTYMWDDHDWLGNEARGDSEDEPGAREAGLISYQAAIPHHALDSAGTWANSTTTNDTLVYPNGTAAAVFDDSFSTIGETSAATNNSIIPTSPYQAFTIGTVRFVLTDLRSESTATSMWSEQQRAWFFNELSEASKYDFVIWISTKIWIGNEKPMDDSWLGAPTERAAVSDFISSTLGGDDSPQNLLVVSADAHMLAFDNGTNTYYGDSNNKSSVLSFPILHSGPLDRRGSVKGGPFTDGCFAVRWERNHHYTTIAFQVPPAVTEGSAEENSIARRPDACMDITAYNAGSGSTKVDKHVAYTKRLCGKIFQPSVRDVRVGTCVAMRATRTPRILFWLVIATLLGTSVLLFRTLNCRQAAQSVALLWVAWIVTMCVGLLTPYAMGYKQFDLTTTLAINLAQSLTSGLAVLIWIWQSDRKVESSADD